jgi:thymidylate synthase ThyX
MNLRELLNQGRLRLHKTSKEEISNLLKLVRRDIEDAKVEGLSSDRKFATAYNAILWSLKL